MALNNSFIKLKYVVSPILHNRVELKIDFKIVE